MINCVYTGLESTLPSWPHSPEKLHACMHTTTLDNETERQAYRSNQVSLPLVLLRGCGFLCQDNGFVLSTEIRDTGFHNTNTAFI